MQAEVLSIGDELTSGQRLDTNSQWLSERLGELGIRVLYHTTVADDLEANVRVFREAIARVDVVVATGGLGPTADDLTRDALAAATDTKLLLDDASLAHIRALFAFFQREMPERNRVQALFPEGSQPIPNPNGTAPGIAMQVPRAGRLPAWVYCLPGVPAEMTEMWQQSVAPELARATGCDQVICHRRIKVFGAGESHVEQMMPDLIRRGREPSVGITVSGATITLRITARGRSTEQCQAAMEPTVKTIHECLGDLVFGEEDDELEHAVARLLVSQQKTLATVEWGSGGLVAQWLNEVPQAAGRYLGGLVLGSEASASSLLGIAPELLSTHGVRSAQVTAALAQACRQRLGADLGLAISPLPPLDPQATEAERIHYALATSERVIQRSVPYAGHPAIHKLRTAKVGLNLVRLALMRSAML